MNNLNLGSSREKRTLMMTEQITLEMEVARTGLRSVGRLRESTRLRRKRWTSRWNRREVRGQRSERWRKKKNKKKEEKKKKKRKRKLLRKRWTSRVEGGARI
jgi:hypothetical protein